MITADLTKEHADVIAGRIRTGTSTLIGESKALGFRHNGPLRAALKEHLGAEAYATLMLGKRGRQPSRVSE